MECYVFQCHCILAGPNVAYREQINVQSNLKAKVPLPNFFLIISAVNETTLRL